MLFYPFFNKKDAAMCPDHNTALHLLQHPFFLFFIVSAVAFFPHSVSYFPYFKTITAIQSLFCNFKGTFQRNNTVKYQMLWFAVFTICTEISISYKLEAIKCFCLCQLWLYITFFKNHK